MNPGQAAVGRPLGILRLNTYSTIGVIALYQAIAHARLPILNQHERATQQSRGATRWSGTQAKIPMAVDWAD